MGWPPKGTILQWHSVDLYASLDIFTDWPVCLAETVTWSGDLMVEVTNGRDDGPGDSKLHAELADSVTSPSFPSSGIEIDELRNLLEAAVQARRLARAETAQIEAELIHLLAANSKMREELTRIQASRSYRGSQRVVRLLRRAGLKPTEPTFQGPIDN